MVKLRETESRSAVASGEAEGRATFQDYTDKNPVDGRR